MKILTTITILIMITGCSGVTEHKHYEIIPNKSLFKTTVHDWVEDLTEPTFGVLRPPLYAYKYNDEYYIFYPVLIEEKNICFGPAFLPVIPTYFLENQTDNKEKILFIRHFKTGGIGSISPSKVSVNFGKNNYAVQEINHEETKEIGVLYSYQLNQLIKDQKKFQVVLELIDGQKAFIDYTQRKDLWVAPIFSFNEPPKKPKVEIYQ